MYKNIKNVSPSSEKHGYKDRDKDRHIDRDKDRDSDRYVGRGKEKIDEMLP